MEEAVPEEGRRLMRDADGNWYPDPPEDPAERARWKTFYFARNYGASAKLLNEILKREPSMWNIPKVKIYPVDAIQCNECGGHGCQICNDRGWLPKDHPQGRRCERTACLNPIAPDSVAVYCSNRCAALDA
jgi:hypothetical protein